MKFTFRGVRRAGAAVCLGVAFVLLACPFYAVASGSVPVSGVVGAVYVVGFSALLTAYRGVGSWAERRLLLGGVLVVVVCWLLLDVLFISYGVP